MICANCGANNPRESAFCGGCGARLAATLNLGDAGSLPSVTPPDDTPTLRAAPESVGGAMQPPAEFAQSGSPAPQMIIEQHPAPGWAGGALPTPPPAAPGQNWASGAAYAAQPAPAQGWPGGTYPPTGTSGMEFPAGVYPTPGAAFTSGSYPPVTPAPGQMSGVYPGQQSQPGWAGYPGQVALPVTAGPSALVKPLPLWAFLLSILVVALLLAVLIFFTGADWSAGAQTAGIVALIVGALIVIAFGVRAALGMLAQTNAYRRSQIISTLLLALILFGLGAVGLTQGAGIHSLQAHFLEAQQKWQLAINEYQDSGQSAPVSDDIARTYVEWGELLASQQPSSDQQYTAALGKFALVITTYPQASTQVVRAQKDMISTSEGAGDFDSQSKNYAGATRYYDALLGQAYCTASCQTQVGNRDATAYYNLAEQNLTAQKYAEAAAAFNMLTTKFGSSAQAQKAHADYAKSLWGEGQAQLTTTCSSAVATYQQLATNFSDTSEGQQAATALKQPQAVTGQFTSTIPGGTNTPQVGLVQGITPNMSSNAFYALLAKSPVSSVQSDGKFRFPPVAQGAYFLVWGVANSADNQVVFLVGQHYPATVGPLCSFDYGSISENFPTA
jgi:tetratricopeptide (TPR) repeat protein